MRMAVGGVLELAPSGIPALAPRPRTAATSSRWTETAHERWYRAVPLAPHSQSFPFLSTCCTITKTRSLEPLPYVSWMRIAGDCGSARIKIGRGLSHSDSGRNSSGLLELEEGMDGHDLSVIVWVDCIIAARIGSGVRTWFVNKSFGHSKLGRRLELNRNFSNYLMYLLLKILMPYNL